MRRTCLACLVAFSLLSVPAAHAEGSETISGASTVVYGQQQFGFLHFVKLEDCRQWWLLPVISGDHVQIDWEVQSDPYIELSLYPSGTTDFNFPQKSSLSYQFPNSNLKAELQYVSPETASLPMEITDLGCHGNAEPGPYNFTAYVTHSVVVASPTVSGLHGSGTVTVGVHDPAGGTVTNPALTCALEIKGRGSWTTVGTGPVENSRATIHFKIPARLRHQQVALRAVASGPGYFKASSVARKVRVL